MGTATVTHHRQVFVGLGNGVLRQRVVLEGLNRCTREPTAVDENLALVALNGDAVVGVVADDELNITRIGNLKQEICCRVVAVPLDGHPILETDWMFGCAGNPGRAAVLPGLASLLKSPGSDIDVVRPPVRQLAAGILVPPTKLIVAVGVWPGTSLFPIPVLGCSPLEEAVVNRRCRPQPTIPVEALGHLGHWQRTAGGCSADRRGHLFDFPHPTCSHQGDRLDE